MKALLSCWTKDLYQHRGCVFVYVYSVGTLLSYLPQWRVCVDAVNRQIEILELKDLEKEYVLARCRLTLAQQDPSSAAIAGLTRTLSVILTCMFCHVNLGWPLPKQFWCSLCMCACVRAGSASAVEMVSLLVQAGLFDTALSLCETFKLSLTPVFEGLAFKWVTSNNQHSRLSLYLKA